MQVPGWYDSVRRPKVVRIVACFIIEWSKPLCDIAPAVVVQLYVSASFEFNQGICQRHCLDLSQNTSHLLNHPLHSDLEPEGNAYDVTADCVASIS